MHGRSDPITEFPNMHTSRNRLSAALAILGAGLAQFAGSATDRVLAAASARNARPPRRRETSRVLAYWGRSKYMPHQGRRECLRRKRGGFAGVASHWKGRDHDAAVAYIMKHHA